MRQCVMGLVFCFLLSSCGGSSSDSMPGQVPSGSVTGVAHDGVLNGATITVKNFSTGSILGTTTTDQNGNYSVHIQAENMPLVIEVTGGFYVEDASGTSENLTDGQKLRAVINYNTNSSLQVSITPFTNAAAGLAAYRSSHGMAAAAAIDSANHDISGALGFDIIATKPRDITNAANLTAVSSNEYSYGFLCAAISSWTTWASKVNGELVPATYNSISFSQLMYDDIVADGLLDGKGQSGALSFGTIPLNVNIYRYAFAAHVIQMGNSDKNKTSLTAAKLLPFASAYASSASAIFAGVAPVPFNVNGPASIAFNSPAAYQALGGYINVSATATSLCAIESATLQLASVPTGSTPVIAVAPVPATPTFSIFVSGGSPDPNSFVLTVVDSCGIPSMGTLPIRIDKTPPTLTILYAPPAPGWPLVISGSYTLPAWSSGIKSISFITRNGDTEVATITETDATSGTWSIPWLNGNGPVTAIAIDNAGNTCTSIGSYYTNWHNGMIICQ